LTQLKSASRANKIAAQSNDVTNGEESEDSEGSDEEGEEEPAGEETQPETYVRPTPQPANNLAADEILLLARELAVYCSVPESSASSSSSAGTAPSGFAVFDMEVGTPEQLEAEQRSAAVLTRQQLLLLLSLLPAELGLHAQARHGAHVCVGMLGYPNVGKSSVINSLLGVAKSSHGI
jgi:predicted GTPase